MGWTGHQETMSKSVRWSFSRNEASDGSALTAVGPAWRSKFMQPETFDDKLRVCSCREQGGSVKLLGVPGMSS